MHDDRTPRGWPLPHAENYLEGDVERLRQALSFADGAATDLAQNLGALELLVQDNMTTLLDALELKADKTAMTQALGLKADATAMAEALGLKADLTAMTAAIDAHDGSDIAHKLTAAQWLLLRSLVPGVEDAGKSVCVAKNAQGQMTLKTDSRVGFVMFDVPGSYQWVVPHGVRLLFVSLCGGGGGGGGGSYFNSTYRGGAGGGGGGGGCQLPIFISEEFWETAVTVTVGSGGAGGPIEAEGKSGGISAVGGWISASGGAGGKTQSDSSYESPSGQPYYGWLSGKGAIPTHGGGGRGGRSALFALYSQSANNPYGDGGNGGDCHSASYMRPGEPGKPGIVIIQYL